MYLDEATDELRSLLREAYRLSETRGARVFKEYPQYERIRAIGELIHQIGGFEQMQQTYHYFRVSEPMLGIMLDRFWHGIGGWMA